MLGGYREWPARAWEVEGIWGNLGYEMVDKGFGGWGG